MEAEKTIVIGLDGAHFEIIEPWIEQGKLPNIKYIIEGGVTADMQSVLPPVTSPNWKAYSTGKNPGKLGIFWWENVDMEGKQVYYPDERKNTHEEFWELIGEDSSAGVVNVPTTYPPREVNSFIVSGAPDGKETGYTHPNNLESELRDKFEYRVTKDRSLKTCPDEAAREIVELIDLRFRAGKDLLDKYDPVFLQITTFYLNSLHHFFWDDERTLEGWEVVDRHIGDFLQDDFNVVLMSDHGATEIDTVFHINAWLEQEGYLTTDMRVAGTMENLGLTKERLLELTSNLGIRDIAKQLTPQAVIDRIPSESGEINRESKTANLDWNASSALASGQGPVYIKGDGEKYQQIRKKLIKALSELKNPDGKIIADEVHRGENVFHGAYADEAPDIIIDQADGVHIQGGLGRQEVFSQPDDDGWQGENKRDALFVANGPDFGTGHIDQISILDLAPTFLHLHGCAVPANMDGEVLKGAFDRDSSPFSRDVSREQTNSKLRKQTKVDSESSEVRSRLEDLGYLE
ncbi:alkaline phosphatase family protein [Halorubrum laminariae]|uniref:Alkaline phosphatase family protein n=1 Tax=Halorubrum laminariae TaxID=1433523 RepID=A0ABD6C1I4_9EURY|nr:alkaline phosphatase family protein [Halorubrum laminariae]